MESPRDGCEEGGKDVGRVDGVDGEDVEDVGLVHGVRARHEGDEGDGAEDTRGDFGEERAKDSGRRRLALPVGAILRHLHGAACVRMYGVTVW